jgi:flagella basal body P-ring formation protein FlgA
MYEIEPDNTPSAALRRMLLLLVGALVLAFGIAAHADSVRLYDQAGIDTEKVTLADVAELSGPLALALGEIELAMVTDGRGEVEISLDEVESALDEAGVNWGQVSLRGFPACRVTRLAPPTGVGIGRGQAVAANIETPLGLDAGLTLRARVEALIVNRTGLPSDELRIGFNDRDSARLDRPVLGQSFEIEPTGLNKLGRVPLMIRFYESGRVTQTLSVRAHVQRVLLAVVASGPIQRGQIFTLANLAVRECRLESDGVIPITDPMLAVGQQATATMRDGEVLIARKVKAPVMVKRGELVTVRCLIGGLIVRTVGRAAEEGSLDDIIQVRSEKNRSGFSAVVSGRGEVVITAPQTHDPRQASALSGPLQGAVK